MNFGQQFGFDQADALSKAGQMMQQDQQGQMTNAANQFYLAQDRPMDLISQFLSMINGGSIPTTSGVGPTGYIKSMNNPLFAGLKGGMGGAQFGYGFGR